MRPQMLLFTIVALAGLVPAVQGAEPAPAGIPGISAPDAYPGGCVDCHVANAGGKAVDARLGPQLALWESGKVPAALLATAQGAAPAGLKLKGRHPDATDALDDIPAACADCHTEDSKRAPPLARMVHRIHLSGGDHNRYVTEYQARCTNCHKFDAATGAWSVPSGPQKK
jgi:hypothetical protein